MTRRFERFGPTGAKAETALTTYLRDRRRQSGGDTLTPDSKVSDLLDDWLRNADDGSRRPQTLTDYRSAVDGHIKPGIGQVRIREATVGTIDRFLRGIKGDGIRKRTRTVLSLAFGYAARLDLVAANPVRDTTTVRKRSNGVEVPKLADVHRYRAAIVEWSGANRMGKPRGQGLVEVVDVVLGTGLRPGEVLALRVQDVDVDAGTLTVAGTVVGSERQPTPKTRKGHRTVKLPAFVVEAIRRRLEDPVVELTGLVFPSATGTVRSRANLDRQLREARPDDLADVTLRSLRRLAATTVDRALGVEAASQQLGHSGTAVTERHYIDRPDVGPEVADVLGKLAPPIE
ncbi:site-specific integrase [Rhodococcus sp. MSC1_016]|uniref:site-specific integrase n=1 Tax=Rhodococcus sp. MSC1_016 TaxID=2909266 RepID=UPI00202E9A29|nr:tyrosine-type recombinase/integrase [Rhodococcus sp. MSC1_016]